MGTDEESRFGTMFATSNGKNELRITKEEPRQVTPMMTKIDPTMNSLGITRRNSIEEVAPVKPKPSNNFLR